MHISGPYVTVSPVSRLSGIPEPECYQGIMLLPLIVRNIRKRRCAVIQNTFGMAV